MSSRPARAVHTPGDGGRGGGGGGKATEPDHAGSGSDDDELGEMGAYRSYLGTPRAILCKFILFTVCFSMNHGCVTGVLAYVQVFFGDVAQVSVATLYGLYTGTALLLSAVIVDWATYKYALLFGLTLYCIYVACYAVGGGFVGVREPVIITGAVVGGFAAGFLWTAQGPYFKAVAEEYARATNSPSEKATGLFAGIFAFCYLGCEVLLKLVARPAFGVGGNETVTLESPGVVGLFSGYAVISIASCVGIMFIPDVPIPASAARVPWYHKIVAVLKLVFTNPRAVLLGPAQCSYGFCVELLGLYVSVELCKCSGSFGDDVLPDLPWMAAAVPTIAALLQVPVSLLVKAFGRPAVATMMVLGQLAFISMGAMAAFVGRDALAAWGYGLMAFFVLQGIGRAAFEGANRVTYAGMFKQEDASAAFSSVTLFSGVSTTIAYAVFKDLVYTDGTGNCTYEGEVVKNYDGATIGWTVFVAGIAGLVCYLLALAYDAAQRLKEKRRTTVRMHEPGGGGRGGVGEGGPGSFHQRDRVQKM